MRWKGHAWEEEEVARFAMCKSAGVSEDSIDADPGLSGWHEYPPLTFEMFVGSPDIVVTTLDLRHPMSAQWNCWRPGARRRLS